MAPLRLKQCTHCGKQKPPAEFYRNKAKRDGLCDECKSCRRDKNKARWANMTESQHEAERGKHRARYATDEGRDSQQTASRRWKRKTPRHTLGMARLTAVKRRPTENPMTIDDLMAMWNRQQGKCALSGLPMTWPGAPGRAADRKKRVPNSVSIDRIDPQEGYALTNVRLVCDAMNCFRGQMSDDEMLAMARALIDYQDRIDLAA